MRKKYDVVIVGAGMGGLVCGSLLAKWGQKVLIVERSSQPGGYCTSYKIKNFEFDSFVHSLGNMSEGNQLYSIIRLLNIENRIKLIRFNPTDAIVTPDYKVQFWNDFRETIQDFSKSFPSEAGNIGRFFNDVMSVDKMDAVVLFRKKTFLSVLDSYFKDYKLKMIMSLVILGNLGTPASLISAFTAMKHYRQFMLDGGYYPEGGIQMLPNAFAEKFIEMGGQLILSRKVAKIDIIRNRAAGIVLQDGDCFDAKYIVSDCDVMQTFLEMIGEEHLSVNFVRKIREMLPSLSLAVVYIGLRKNHGISLQNGVNNWYLMTYDYSKPHENGIDYNYDGVDWIMVRPNYGKQHLMIFASAPFKSHEYWMDRKHLIMNIIIKKASEFVPALSDAIEYKNCTTPSSLNKWTLNARGAAYGWASLPSQFMDTDFISDSIVENLFFCGHWSTLAQGVPGVSIVGEKTAKRIFARIKAGN